MELLVLLGRCHTLVTQLKATGRLEKDAAAIKELKAAFCALGVAMCEHMAEEEEAGLPLLRRCFAHSDMAEVLGRLRGDLAELGWMLRPLTLDGRKEFLTEFVRAPVLVQRLILLPQAGKYERNVQRLLDEVRAGKRTPRTSLSSWIMQKVGAAADPGSQTVIKAEHA